MKVVYPAQIGDDKEEIAIFQESRIQHSVWARQKKLHVYYISDDYAADIEMRIRFLLVFDYPKLSG
jgi:hypothetical protein